MENLWIIYGITGWCLGLHPWKRLESIGMMKFPIYGKNVPNHQPAFIGAENQPKKHQNIIKHWMKVLNSSGIHPEQLWHDPIIFVHPRRLPEWLPTLLCHAVVCVRSSVTKFHSMHPPGRQFSHQCSRHPKHSSKYIWRLVYGLREMGIAWQIWGVTTIHNPAQLHQGIQQIWSG